MATVYLALGSNVGDSKQEIEQAIGLLGSAVNNIQRAPLYRSKAMGYTDQPDFLNTAIKGETTLSPEELLTFTQATEQKVGRIERFRWGPREIDIDIIFYDDLRQKTDTLTLPHPAYRERDFVLQPLLDLGCPTKDPLSDHSVGQLLEELTRTGNDSNLKKVDETD